METRTFNRHAAIILSKKDAILELHDKIKSLKCINQFNMKL
jgi:hypothetical protein